MNSNSKVRKIAFVGDHLPRKCCIATFTTDLLAAVASSHPQSECLAVSVNDIPGGYGYLSKILRSPRSCQRLSPGSANSFRPGRSTSISIIWSVLSFSLRRNRTRRMTTWNKASTRDRV